MKRKSSRATCCGAAVLALVCGSHGASAGEGAASAANAYESGAYDPWAGFGNHGNGPTPENAAAMGNYAAIYNYAWTTGYNGDGGYPGGTCCNGIWDGYCAEKRKWCERHAKCGGRLFGCGACRRECRTGPAQRNGTCTACDCGAPSTAAATVSLKSASPSARPVLKPVPSVPN
ncbi:MAG TPA: hypothetical protein VGX78_08095 [Pirellulales bacterium]|nr:hypothetical protein [Pirellulales bacterium]